MEIGEKVGWRGEWESYLREDIFVISTLAMTASCSSQLRPAVQTEVGQNVDVQEDFGQRFARRVDSRMVALDPIELTPGSPVHEIRNAFCKTVISSFFTRFFLRIDFPWLHHQKSSPHFVIDFKVNRLSLANIFHVGSLPKLIFLVQKHLETSSVVINQIVRWLTLYNHSSYIYRIHNSPPTVLPRKA